jgi:hypothetical protein
MTRLDNSRASPILVTNSVLQRDHPNENPLPTKFQHEPVGPKRITLGKGGKVVTAFADHASNQESITNCY